MSSVLPSGLAVDVQQHGVAALRGDGSEDRLRPALDARHVLDLHRMAAVNRNHQILNVRRRMNAPVHRRQVKMIIFLHHAGGREEIVFRQRIAHVRQARCRRPAISAGQRRHEIPARGRR